MTRLVDTSKLDDALNIFFSFNSIGIVDLIVEYFDVYRHEEFHYLWMIATRPLWRALCISC